MNKMTVGVMMGLLLMVTTSQFSYAEQSGYGDGGPQWGPHMMHQKLSDRDGLRRLLWKRLMSLDLSDKQRDALRAIRSRVQKDTIQKKADLGITRVELRDLLRREQVDMNAVEANLKKAESIRTDLRFSHIKAREEVKAVLTPEQRKKLKEDMKASRMRGDREGGRMMAPQHGRLDDNREGIERSTLSSIKEDGRSY
ncbi:MAG TPA: periplasmic heavy metal sensor [Nitrospirota bacterium]|nr:periplasmic heavy metal sensor [Nitrospirota bacterium]